MIFWFLASILALLSALGMVWPLFQARSDVSEHSEAALAVFRDQLNEIDRDLARGLIKESEAQAAQVEIKRRMLAADKMRSAEKTHKEGSRVLIALALITPLASLGLYHELGAPNVVSMPFADRQEEQKKAQDLEKLTAKLRRTLENEAGGGETRGWELLASTYMNMNRHRDAVYAFSKIVGRPDATSATWAQYAEALIAMEQGIVTKPARQAIDKALTLDPQNPAGSYYKAMAVAQSGDQRQAREILLERMQQEPAFQPWMQAFLSEANRLGHELGVPPVAPSAFAGGKGPTQADITAANELDDEERSEFIRSMVARLAERLEENPEDLNGWIRLARAYMVLSQPENARAALERAKSITDSLPRKDSRRMLVEETLLQLSKPSE